MKQALCGKYMSLAQHLPVSTMLLAKTKYWAQRPGLHRGHRTWTKDGQNTTKDDTIFIEMYKFKTNAEKTVK